MVISGYIKLEPLKFTFQGIVKKAEEFYDSCLEDNDEDLVDKMFSGYYIISAINHYATRERHECHMELIKDSIQLKIDRNK
jgi:hypothetical protein